MNNLNEKSAYRFDSENHLHSFENKPLYGTSTVLGVVSKPLTYWASGLAVQTLSGVKDCKVFTKLKNGKATETEINELNGTVIDWLTKNKNISTKDYINLLGKAYTAHASTLKEKAEEGVDLHAEAERFVKNQILLQPSGMIDTTEYDQKIKPFIDWSKANVDKFLFSEMHTYSDKHWLGGIVDCGVKLKNGEIAVIDFKSAKDAYNSHFWQIAGYAIQIEENGGFNADGVKTFELEKPITQFIVFPFGAAKVEAKVSRRIEESKGAFLAALTIHKEKVATEN